VNTPRHAGDPRRSADPAARVRIVHSRTAAVRRATSRGVLREIDEQTVLGEVYLRSLVRSQLRLGLLVCMLAAVTLGGTALWMALDPGLSNHRLLGMPLGWLLLGLFVYPILIGMGVYYVRHAERIERDFNDLVRQR
jgi:hypothetical protein